MKIAAIVPYTFLPYQSGGQKAIAQLYDYLGQQAEVYVIGTSGNDAALAKHYTLHPLLGSGLGRYANPLLFGRIKKLLFRLNIQTVIIEHPYHAWLGWLLKTAGFTVVFRAHNIEFDRFRSIDKWWWPLLKQYERRAYRLAHRVLFISAEDRQLGIDSFQLQPEKCAVVPFGIPLQQEPLNKQAAREQLLHAWNLPADTRLLLFTGSYGYQPNMDAVQAIITHIVPALQQWPHPFRVLVTGKGLPEALQEQIRHCPGIIYTGFIPAIEAYFTGADLLLNTILSGGGVKTKLIEAIGFGTTVVSTATGAIGADAAACGHKLVTVADNDWPGFAAAIVQHAGQAAATPQAFYQQYYWGHITTRLLALLNEHSK